LIPFLERLYHPEHEPKRLAVFRNPEFEVFMAVTLKNFNTLKFIFDLLDDRILNQIALQTFNELDSRNLQFVEIHFHKSALELHLLLKCQFFHGDSLLDKGSDRQYVFAFFIDA